LPTKTGYEESSVRPGTLFLNYGAQFDVGDSQHRIAAYSDVMQINQDEEDPVRIRRRRSSNDPSTAAADFALRHPDRRSAYPQRIVDVAAANAPGPPGQPLPQPQPQPWPQQGMQPPADRGVEPDGPWSPDAADTRPFSRRIPADWLIAGALVLVSAVAGWYMYASRSATGEPEVAPAEPTQVRTGVATPDEIDESGDLNWDEINIDDSVDVRVTVAPLRNSLM
jgi:hypothetical protein